MFIQLLLVLCTLIVYTGNKYISEYNNIISSIYPYFQYKIGKIKK